MTNKDIMEFFFECLTILIVLAILIWTFII